jgi:hypothetical protein
LTGAEISGARVLFRHARPAGALWVPVIPLVGWGFAHWDRALVLRRGGAALVVAAAWLLIHCGTMWLNASLDRDDRATMYGEPTPVPRWLPWAAYAALAAAPAITALVDLRAAACALGCSLLGVVYSHPATRWKAHPFAGPAVNILGYAILSPLAGWAIVGVDFSARMGAVLAILVAYAGAPFLGAQAFQAEDDRARGYRTLVATHGPRVVLTAARLCLWIGTSALTAASLLGWFPRLCALVLVPAWIGDRYIAAWLEQPGGGDARWAQGFAKRLMLLGVVLFAVAYADYGVDLLRGSGQVAGLGTAAGHPN